MKKKNKSKTKQNYTKANTSTYTYTKTKSTYYDWSNWKNKKEEPHVYKGKKNQTEFPYFIDLCKATQMQLKASLPIKLLNAGYRDVIVEDGYIYAKGDIPVLLTAHMDTVHKETIKDFYEDIDEKGNHIISSPQGIGGDDRCGIYMILQLIKEFKPYVLFCEDEETGGIGSSKFCKTEFINELSDLRFLIELDRANGNDAVFYDCENPDFTKFIEDTTGFKKAYGSFSDISNLAPACKVAAVNLSCGYYHAHTLKEEVVVEDMFKTMEAVKKLLTTESEQFEYIEEKSYDYGYGYNYGYSYSGGCKGYYNKWDFWDDYEDVYLDEDNILLCVNFYEGGTFDENYKEYYAPTEAEAWVKFFKDNPNTSWNLVLDYDIMKI